MAKVWLAREGVDPTIGGPFRDIVLADHLAQLGLKFISGLDSTPRFGTGQRDLVRGPRHVVVEVDVEEARRNGLSPGFYVAQLSVQEALVRVWD